VVDPFLDVYKHETIPELLVLQDQVAQAIENEARPPRSKSRASPRRCNQNR